MIEFYQLEQLVTIAKEGTLSKAAEVLLISQPALTRSIQRLEDDLNIKLFDRKKNKITFNKALKKIIESNRVNKETKDEIRKMKLK